MEKTWKQKFDECEAWFKSSALFCIGPDSATCYCGAAKEPHRTHCSMLCVLACVSRGRIQDAVHEERAAMRYGN